MPRFRYQAMAADGELVEGEIEARDHATAIKQIQVLGHTPIRAEELRGAVRSPIRILRRRRGRLDLARFTRDLATLLKAGVSLERSLEMLADLADEGQAAGVITRILEEVRGGQALADALEGQSGVFSRFYVNMIRAGEAGGALEAVLARLSAFLEQYDELRRSVQTALIYPGILLFVTLASLTILMAVVVPQFKSLFEDMGQELPTITRVVIGAGEAFQSWWWVLALLIFGAAWLLRRALARADFRLRWDGWMLDLPLVGELVTRIQVAVFARTLATLVASGVALLNALGIVCGTLTNRVLAGRLGEATDRVREGERLADGLTLVGGFPRLAIHLVRVGEETGELEPTLFQLADIYDREVRVSIQRMLSLLEPALIIGLGVLIGGIIMSILVAILSVNELVF